MHPDDFDFDECWNCGGEGRVAGICIDGACLEQDDPYCEYCSHRCDVCGGSGAITPEKDEPCP